MVFVLILVPLLLLAAALFGVYRFGLYAVAVCSLVGAGYVGLVLQVLKGVGRPNADVPAFNFSEWLTHALYALLPIAIALLAYHFLIRAFRGVGG